MKRCYCGKIILSDKVMENAFVTVQDGIITFVGDKKPSADEYVDIDGYIAPGFVDIHCHDALDVAGYEDPLFVANYHYNHGTTSILISVYRGLKHIRYIEILEAIKDIMPKTKNLRGVHMEGPYLNGNYGCNTENQEYPEKENYKKYLDYGIIRQWTCSPEVEGTYDLISDIKDSGCIPAIGHSEASYTQVCKAVSAGARIVTHIFDATGTTPDGRKYEGTHDMSFSEACMLADDMYYEIICDRDWIHVRKEMLKLLEKTVGIDRIVAITDCSLDITGDELDINLVNGEEIWGSKLTMDVVAANLFNAGYSMNNIAKMTALNPSLAINLEKRGEIKEGNYADLIEVDDKYLFKKIITCA